MIPRRRHHPFHNTRCTTSATEQASCQRNGMRNSGEPQRKWADPAQPPTNTVPYTAAALAAITGRAPFSLDGW
jgi:hypothetical protein